MQCFFKISEKTNELNKTYPIAFPVLVKSNRNSYSASLFEGIVAVIRW